MIDQNPTDRPGYQGLSSKSEDAEPYDATRDPRTGRPPNPLETQRLAREHDEGKEDEALSELEGSPDIDLTDEDGPDLPAEQAPARMVSPTREGDREESAADELVNAGVARERAEELIEEHGPDLERLKAAAFAGDAAEANDGLRKEALAEHHEQGIPPFEPPTREV